MPTWRPLARATHFTCDPITVDAAAPTQSTWGMQQPQLTRWQAINKPPARMYLQSKYELRIRHVVCFLIYPIGRQGGVLPS